MSPALKRWAILRPYIASNKGEACGMGSLFFRNPKLAPISSPNVLPLMPNPSSRALTAIAWLILIHSAGAQLAPNDNDAAVRVSVTINPDGSKTVYQFDQPHHQATATTTSADGKVTGKIRYQIDDAGRFSSGVVFGADEKFLFRSTYKYKADGRLDEETHLGKDDAVINKIVYSYDTAGRHTGYAIVGPDGKLIGKTGPKATPTATPKKPKVIR
jgi:hypothetical protein